MVPAAARVAHPRAEGAASLSSRLAFKDVPHAAGRMTIEPTAASRGTLERQLLWLQSPRVRQRPASIVNSFGPALTVTVSGG
jgi:hypothetical protein